MSFLDDMTDDERLVEIVGHLDQILVRRNTDKPTEETPKLLVGRRIILDVLRRSDWQEANA